MKLSYKDNKTIIEVDGKQMRVLEAILKYPKLAKQIIKYSKDAKKLSEVKTVFVTYHKKCVHPNPTTRESVETPEYWSVEGYENGIQKRIKAFESQKELKEFLKDMGVENAYMKNEMFLTNGKPFTQTNYDFMQSFLNGVELDVETGKISTEVEPSFKRCDLNREDYYPYAFIVGKDIRFVQDYYLDDADRHGGTFAKVQFAVKGKNISYETTVILYFENGQSKEWEEKGNITEMLKSAKVDLVNAKVGAILSDYSEQKIKYAEETL